MSSDRVYVVTVTNVEEHENVRVYRDRAEAEVFAAAYIPGWGTCEIEVGSHGEFRTQKQRAQATRRIGVARGLILLRTLLEYMYPTINTQFNTHCAPTLCS